MYSDLSQREIEHILFMEHGGRIGCHSDGPSYVVPVCYGYDGTHVYGHTRDGMKLRIMHANPSCPVDAITMSNAFELTATSRDGLMYQKSQLAEIGASAREYFAQ